MSAAVHPKAQHCSPLWGQAYNEERTAGAAEGFAAMLLDPNLAKLLLCSGPCIDLGGFHFEAIGEPQILHLIDQVVNSELGFCKIILQLNRGEAQFD